VFILQVNLFKVLFYLTR